MSHASARSPVLEWSAGMGGCQGPCPLLVCQPSQGDGEQRQQGAFRGHRSLAGAVSGLAGAVRGA